MIKHKFIYMAAMVAMCLPGAAHADVPDSTVALRVLGSAEAPIGYTQFCMDFPGECLPVETAGRRVILTPGVWGELNRVNTEINEAIKPATDLELYGVLERWTLTEDYGDCEDYVLVKRKRLMEIGWPADALLITVVRDEKGDGHAVLTAATDRGDFVLDNQRGDIRPWHRTGYSYVKRQSQFDINSWVYLGTPDDIQGVASTR